MLLGKNVEEIFTRGKRTKGVVEAGIEKTTIFSNEKAKLFSLLQKMSSMADCCSSEDKNKTKHPLRSLEDPNKVLSPDKRAPRAPAAGPNVFLKARTSSQKGGTVRRSHSASGRNLPSEMLDPR